MSATTLLLARHGQTVWHEDNRYAGTRSDVDLTEEGAEQAMALARWVKTARLDAVVASPVRRALETAIPAAQAAGLSLQVEDDLREVDFGIAEGRTLAELRDLDAPMVRRFTADPVGHPFPKAEPPLDAAARGAAALRKAAAAQPGGRVLVVAHNTLLRLAICELVGLPVERYRQIFPRLANAAVSELLVPADAIEVGEPASLLTLNCPVLDTPVGHA